MSRKRRPAERVDNRHKIQIIDLVKECIIGEYRDSHKKQQD